MSTPEPKVQVVHTLSKEVYEALLKKLPPPHVTSQTTPTETAYLVGVQKVLAVLREGWVVG